MEKFIRTLNLKILIRAGLLSLLTIVFTGCSDLFKVDNPNQIEESDLSIPEMITALSNSAEGALSGSYGSAIMVGELPGDAILGAQTCNCFSHMIDRGIFGSDHGTSANLFDNLSSANWTAGTVRETLLELIDNPESDIAISENYFWDAIGKITLADLYEEIPLDGGAPKTPVEIYEIAIDLFKNSITIAKAYIADNPSDNAAKNLLAAAYTSLARTYRTLYFETSDLNDFVNAYNNADLALQTAPKFYLDMEIESPGTSNSIFSSVNRGTFDGIEPTYKGLKDPFSDIVDPRILIGDYNRQSSWGDSLFNQEKYPDVNANYPISRWQEAELIIAEYKLLTNDLPGAVAHINEVRREAAPLIDFSSSDETEIQEQIIYERKAEFWLELRRWQDMRYYNIIPRLWTPEAINLGIDRRLPVSRRELDGNPNYN